MFAMSDKLDGNVWPPPPTAGQVLPAVDVVPKRVYNAGIASLVISVFAFLLGVTAVYLVPTSFAKQLPHGFLGNCDIMTFGLLIAGVVCGIFGWRTNSGKIGFSLSTGSFCILTALLIADLVQSHVI